MKTQRFQIPLRRALAMIWSYATGKLSVQIRAVGFVVAYLILSQIFLFKVPVENALVLAFGVGATVFGLAFFLEGLFLGIMPLGEQCGIKLPVKTGAIGTALFALIIGITATLAEPAIGILKAQGSAVAPWDAPLLYFFLNRGSPLLVGAVALGVGIAVIVGVLRFIYEWSFRPFVFIIIPILVAIGFYFQNSSLLAPIAGLAWDTGAVTTGPVTVPLVIALGVGVSRISSNRRNSASGLGVVTLASSLPVAGVFILALLMAGKFPQPGTAQTFFSAGERNRALYTVGGEDNLSDLAKLARTNGFISGADLKTAFPETVAETESTEGILSVKLTKNSVNKTAAALQKRFFTSTFNAVMAVLPLAAVLTLTLLLVLRERIRGADEVVLGLFFAVIGMFLFNIGMERGLTSLGTQAGILLPRAYQSTLRTDKAVTLQGVDGKCLVVAVGADGPKEYLWVDGKENPYLVPFDRTQLNNSSGSYRYTPREGAIFGRWGPMVGIVAVLCFLFILGFGSTLAEPSLTALGITVEELTVGTYKKNNLVAVVAVGVGIGIAAGFVRILYDLPLSWVLGVPYGIALLLTAFSSEEFASIAWDCAGVTTGPITVPLVIAAGIGIGSQGSSPSASFGVVACASVFPIIAVLSTGLFSSARAGVRGRSGGGQ